MASLKDVAELAGVSPSTVSYFLNGKKKLRPETCEKIRQAASVLNYQPNTVARSLKMRVSKSVGILVSDLSNVFFLDILAGIENYLTKYGYSSIVANSRNSAQVERDNIQELLNRNIDGIILMGTGNVAVYQAADKNVPIVAIDRIEGAACNTVSTDNRRGGYIGAKYLIENGKRHVVFIGFNQAISYNERYQGCVDAYREMGLEPEEYLSYVETQISPEDGYNVAMELHERHVLDNCDAIFAAADYIAFGALKALHDIELAVPEDISVLGFDDLPISKYMIPALSTVHQPKFEMGQRAAAMLLHILSNEETETDVKLEPGLVIRAST